MATITAQRSQRGEEFYTLTRADIDIYQDGRRSPYRSGGKLRLFCPIHAGTSSQAFQLNEETGHFKCHACGAWGYLVEASEANRAAFLEERKRSEQMNRTSRPGILPDRIATPDPPPTERAELFDVLEQSIAAFPDSPADRYLRSRGIPPEIARAAGIGYSAADRWPGRWWQHGRVVVPQFAPGTDGFPILVNLYGRAIPTPNDIPASGIKHDILPGSKGWLGVAAITAEHLSPYLFITEAPLDALS
ncbi:MAG: hypothetical protein ABI876_05695, partial [Bacteroidota bacterium]